MKIKPPTYRSSSALDLWFKILRRRIDRLKTHDTDDDKTIRQSFNLAMEHLLLGWTIIRDGKKNSADPLTEPRSRQARTASDPSEVMNMASEIDHEKHESPPCQERTRCSLDRVVMNMASDPSEVMNMASEIGWNHEKHESPPWWMKQDRFHTFVEFAKTRIAQACGASFTKPPKEDDTLVSYLKATMKILKIKKTQTFIVKMNIRPDDPKLFAELLIRMLDEKNSNLGTCDQNNLSYLLASLEHRLELLKGPIPPR